MTQEFRREERITVLWNYNIYIVYSFQTHEQTFPVFLMQVRMLFSTLFLHFGDTFQVLLKEE